MDRLDVVIAGAGVVGLAVGRALAQAGREVFIMEREPGIGMVTSSRNSEVIHAGIYYPKDSLKARTCVAGRRRLYAYLEERGIAHRRCGKLIVATDAAQVQTLLEIKARAEANGVEDLRVLDAAQARSREPALAAHGALYSPSTGIVDTHAYMLALQGDLEQNGGSVVLNTEIVAGRVMDDGFALTLADGYTFHCRTFVNAAGLGAQTLCARLEGMPREKIPPLFYAKGSYFTLSGKAPFSHLIYPVPVPGGLGTHLTLDMGGQARFGPNVRWIDEIDYEVNPREAEAFYSDIRAYWPDLPDKSLQPGYAGIRPKLVPRGEPAADFLIQTPQAHGIPGLVNLFGIESPGLTASLALAGEVCDVLK